MKWIVRLFLVSASLGAVGGIFLYFFWPWVFSWQIWTRALNLPNFGSFEEYKPYQTSYFFARGGEILSCIAKPEEWRDALSAADIDLKNAPIARVILAVEDRRFYERNLAIDLRAIARAGYEDLKEFKIVEGGSTIPQQLVKQLLPTEEREGRSIKRKIKEVVLASRLIQRFSKDEIFLLYLNEVPLGHQRIGVEAASLLYFNKRAAGLSYSEAAALAGMIHAPARFSPIKHPDAAKVGRDSALKKAFAEGMVSEEDLNKALAEEILVTSEFQKSCNRAPHAIDYARSDLQKNFGFYFDDEYKNEVWRGIKVHLTLDSELQALSEEGIRKNLEDYRERQGENAIDAESAFLAIENSTGAIVAMVGGGDYRKRKYNHATQAKRQAGSVLKPIVYTAKFEQELAEGKSYNTLLDRAVSNANLSCKDQYDPLTKTWTYWSPRNFDEEKFSEKKYPTMTRRFAIAQSINRPAVWMAQGGKCAMDQRVPIIARKLGIESPLDPKNPLKPTLPSALGAGSFSLLELSRAYSVYPNAGVLRETYIIFKISDMRGQIIYEKDSWSQKPAISEVTAGLITEALRGVVKFGTARSLDSLVQPSACKTGTTERYIDAWLICFTPHITLGTWMGGPEDYTKSLGDRETGARTAPAIRHVLENWYKDQTPVLFSEELEGWMKALVEGKSFKKEMEELEKLEKKEQ